MLHCSGQLVWLSLSAAEVQRSRLSLLKIVRTAFRTTAYLFVIIVPEPLLNEAQVDTGFAQMGGPGVAHCMHGSALVVSTLLQRGRL
jgi:hypothetical protein